jgi:prefoldin subunit 5
MPNDNKIFIEVIEFIQSKKMELLKLIEKMSKEPNFEALAERINNVVEDYEDIIQELRKEFHINDL